MNFPEITIIVGSGRSGTSYLQRTMRDSMDIGFFREPKYIMPIYRQLYKFGDLEKQENLHKLVKRILEEKIFTELEKETNGRAIFDEVVKMIRTPSYSGILYAIFEIVAAKLGKSHLGYKFPGDIQHISTLAEVFPTARFIHLLRDGRDVAISLMEQKWGPKNFYTGSRYWAQRTKQGRISGLKIPDRYLEVRFEDLVLDSDKTAEKLGNFANSGNDPQLVMKFVEQINVTKKTSSVYRWKETLTDEQIRICEAAAGEELQFYGYPLKYEGKASISPLRVAALMTKDVLVRTTQKIRSS